MANLKMSPEYRWHGIESPEFKGGYTATLFSGSAVFFSADNGIPFYALQTELRLIIDPQNVRFIIALTGGYAWRLRPTGFL